MNILIVGNVLKDVYLNLDTRRERFEQDGEGVKWLDLSFDASEHHFFNRESSFGGAAVTLEVMQKMGVAANVSDSRISFGVNEARDKLDASAAGLVHRYILIADEKVSYFAPSEFRKTSFVAPSEAVDYLYVDRSAEIDEETAKKILAYLGLSTKTKLVVYVRNFENRTLNELALRADLVFLEAGANNPEGIELLPEKVIRLSETEISYLEFREKIAAERVDVLTHLSFYSMAAATVLASFVLGKSVEESLALARVNVENAKLNAVLGMEELQMVMENSEAGDDLELTAANLVLKPKGILAADESGGSIKKKFAQLDIEDTYENRRDYRNIFMTTPELEEYVNGVILFDETARQTADTGQNFVEFLTARRIIPGIKVDQGLEKFPDSEETWTKGLDGLPERLAEYYNMGLRFAKWRAAFELRLNENGEVVTPSEMAIYENGRILAEYALACQAAGIVPIVEPEVVYDGYYPVEKNAEVTGRILDVLFERLAETGVNLKACILKVNMVLTGKKYETQSTPDEVGAETAKVLREHVPEELAGVVFLSGGQSVEQATDNLAAVTKNGPFPWPVTFSFARALQDPALYAWRGDNNNADAAREAFKTRLIENCRALAKE